VGRKLIFFVNFKKANIGGIPLRLRVVTMSYHRAIAKFKNKEGW